MVMAIMPHTTAPINKQSKVALAQLALEGLVLLPKAQTNNKINP